MRGNKSFTVSLGVNIARGPLATVYCCPHCKFTVRVGKGHGEGRGYGLRSGSKAFGAVRSHIRDAHPGVTPPADKR